MWTKRERTVLWIGLLLVGLALGVYLGIRVYYLWEYLR